MCSHVAQSPLYTSLHSRLPLPPAACRHAHCRSRLGREATSSSPHCAVLIEITVHAAKDFPPLPVKPESHPHALHSRVSSFHSRSSTPRVPPGFEAHAQPIGSRPASRAVSPERKPTPVDPKIQRIVSTTVLPAVPDLPIGPRASTPKSSTKGKEVKTLSERNETSSPVEEKYNDISYGSPKRRVRQPALPEKQDLVTNTSDTVANPPTKSSTAKASVKDSTPKKPNKIDIPSTTKIIEMEKLGAPAQSQNLDTAAIVTPSVTDSPGTAASATTERDRVPGPRPKTLRLTTTTSAKPATPVSEHLPPSATTEKSTPALTTIVPVPSKDAQHFPHLPASRQHSISSAPRFDKDSRPSTPMSEHSHPASQNPSRMMSEVASRSSTPPPVGNIVGSAPERTKTKNQLKKERREKAKAKEQADAQVQGQKDKDEGAVPSPAKSTPVNEQVAPIISRQKKQKKEKLGKKTEVTPTPKAANSMKNYEEPAPQKKMQEEIGEELPAETQSSSQSPDEDASVLPEPETDPDPEFEPVKAPYTLGQLYHDMAQPGAPSLQTLLAKNTSPFDTMLSDMLASGDITKDHPFLQPPSLTHKDYKLPGDSRKGQTYLDAHGYTNTSAFGYVYVPRSQRRELMDGAPIVVGEEPSKNGKEDLLKSTLITPSGAVMRHLTSKEIDRTLELEERRALYRENFGDDIGGMQGLLDRIENEDNINLEGGIDEIVRHGEGKGVVWVYDSNDEDADGETEEEILEAGEYDEQDEKVWDSADEYGDDEDYEDEENLARERQVNLRGLSDEELQKRVAETQREYDASRKEVERLEKSLGKRSKELAKLRESIFN